MKAERRKAWTDALRSKKYTQGRHLLHPETNTFCCLGVLCDIIDPTCWTGRLGGFYYKKEGIERIYGLPQDLLNEIGGSEIHRVLINANDGVGYYIYNPQDFYQIADLIEKIVPLDNEENK